MHYSRVAFIVGAALSPAPAVLVGDDGLDPETPVLFEDGMPFDFGIYGGLSTLPSAAQTTYRWPWGTVPKWCYTEAVNNGYCNLYDIEVYDVTYSDPDTFCHAYSVGTEQAFFSDCNNSTGTYVHELSHNLDHTVTTKGSYWYWETTEWKHILGQDSCVPDPYARSSLTEAYAQAGVMAL
ncbi:hypothetical protein B0H63DRAFT_524787 [Podospora didyma]|uniref:Lysine-specific metallo-endopeptidase domain-containing protein n=1 Tax=Podospora didyma TaxID=330526 RepID=A0AAE0KIQ2_9PEZI|nr:hypothetical protein B0H63DRAFT_524787 [Podospora didyma]